MSHFYLQLNDISLQGFFYLTFDGVVDNIPGSYDVDNHIKQTKEIINEDVLAEDKPYGVSYPGEYECCCNIILRWMRHRHCATVSITPCG